MTWKNEPSRHALAARGMRTRAILNPIASPRWYNKERYGPGPRSEKGLRPYRGSGLDILDQDEISHWILDANEVLNQILNEENIPLELKVESIYLVGSRVSGFHKKESDLDIVVKYKDIPLNQKSKYLNDIENAQLGMEFVTRDPAWWLQSTEMNIRMDIWWGWELPDEDSPHLKIWEAS